MPLSEIAGAKKDNRRCLQCGGHMHRRGVHADKQFGAVNQYRQFRHVQFSGQIDNVLRIKTAIKDLPDSVAFSGGRATGDHHLFATLHQVINQFAV
ncbi:hypothetical protein D3C80_1750250 [compost metagenome]